MYRIKVQKEHIRKLIPHSGTMCLLDGVIDWDDDTITCFTETHRDPNNPLRRKDRLGAVSALEYGAQAAAIHGGLRAEAAGTSAPPGYLAALRDVELNVERLDNVDGSLLVKARRLFGEAVNTVYECEISSNEKILARGRVTIILRN